MKTAFRLILSFLFLLVMQTSVWAKGNILLVYSQYGTPYDEFAGSLLKIVQAQFPALSFSSISLENHEKYITRHLQGTDLSKVNVVVAIGTVALRAVRDLKELPEGLPVVFGAVTDPVGENVIDDFTSKPKQQFSGVSYAVDTAHRLRFLRESLPDVKNIGVIYSTMPQSVSFKKWLDDVSQTSEFSDLTFHYRRIGMRVEDRGPNRMIRQAIPHVEALKDKVDVFLAPIDQMGVIPEFSQMVVRTANKPVFGLGHKDVLAENAAFASVSPSMEESGEIAAEMVMGLLNGQHISHFIPKRPPYMRVFNPETAQKFGIVYSGQ